MIEKEGKLLADEIKETSVPHGSFAFWWLGQLGYVMKFGETVIYVDAYLSPYEKRQVKPLLAPEDMTGASLVTGSHNHSDHVDQPLWAALAKIDPDVTFIAPAPFFKELTDKLGIAENRLLQANENTVIDFCNIKITPVAAAHEQLQYIDGHSAFLSFVIEGNGCRVLHTGDACIYEGYLTKLKAFGKFDAVFLPINGRDAARYRRGCIGNMTYQEAVDLTGELAPSWTVPGHYEMFADNSCDVELFRDYLDAKFPGQKYWIGNHGQCIYINHDD